MAGQPIADALVVAAACRQSLFQCNRAASSREIHFGRERSLFEFAYQRKEDIVYRG